MDGHQYYDAAAIAAMLDGTQRGQGYRARCPVHGGDNPEVLSIRTVADRDGYPMTMLHCYAHQCAVRDICEALGIPFAGLWSVVPARAAKRPPVRRQSPAITRFAQRDEPGTPDDVLFLLLVASLSTEYGNEPDVEWISTCLPARKEMWRLIQDPEREAALHSALQEAGIAPLPFLRALAAEQDTKYA